MQGKQYPTRHPLLRRAAACAALLLALAWSGDPGAARAEEAPPAVTEPPLDLRGLTNDTTHFIGYNLLAMVAMSQRDRSEEGYIAPPQGFERWWDNVTNPVWDQDAWYNNYVLHPYWGASYYVRGRERGLARGQAFWYSALLSTIFEVGAEAMVEPVSYQDLLITPVIGSLLGEFVFWPARQRILARQGPLDFSDRAILVLTDPLGAINGAVDRVLGIQTDWSVVPRRPPASAFAPGVRPPPRAPGWTLQVRAQW
jgi:hypothetical protein